MAPEIKLTRPLYGDEVTVECCDRYSHVTLTNFEEERIRRGGSPWRREVTDEYTWWFRTRAAPSRAADLHYRGYGALSHVGWADPVTNKAEYVSRPGDRDGEEVLARVARKFDAWQGKGPITARIGVPLAIDDALVTILAGIANGGQFGHDVPWAKGKLSVIPRSLADEILRCDVTASVDHEARDRPAHHELKGTLDLWVPRGWPKRFIADGRWNYPSFVLAGRTIIEGTFHVEVDWSYGTDVPPPPAAPSR